MGNTSPKLKLVSQDLASMIPGTVDLLVIAARPSLLRCKILATGEDITYKHTLGEVPGEIITVRAKRIYMHGKTRCLQGETVSKPRQIDIGSIGLAPLNLRNQGPWLPDDLGDEPDELVEKYIRPVLDCGPREAFEMEQVLPGASFEIDDVSDPISDASELYHAGDESGAFAIIERLLTADLRCIDAHAHLGNWEFERWSHDFNEFGIDHALAHYSVGVRIGELSLGNDFGGVLPWGMIDNRPFLRCMHGLGLCEWRLGKTEDAKKTFHRMLMLNPADNQGTRFCLAAIDDGKSWEELEN